MNDTVKKILTPLASLKITVGLLLAAMLVVYVGTLAQVSMDNFEAQRQFFHSWLVYMPFQHHLPWAWFGDWKPPGGYMFIGGYTIIIGILVNLIAAHTLRFKFVLGDLLLVPVLAVTGYLTWLAQANPSGLLVALTILGGLVALGITYRFHGKRTGVIVIHFGLILILLGELVTALSAVETQMTLVEGNRQDWVQDVRHIELVMIDPAPANHDIVTAVPGSRLAKDGAVVKDPQLPVEVRVDAFYPNASLANASAGPSPVRPTAGLGLMARAAPQRKFTGVGGDAGKVNAPAAYVTLLKGGKPIETLLVSVMDRELQRVFVDGKEYGVALRFQRYYKPYTIHLIDFTHEKHIGTGKAKNFAAHVRLLDPPNGVDREVTVRMNQPLRYAGDTIYQSGFDPDNPKLTTLQVVRNPGWLMPYIACAVGGIGMLIHFLQHLVGFLNKQMGARAGAAVVAAAGKRSGGRTGGKTTVGATYAPGLSGGAYTLTPKSRVAGWLVPTILVALTLFYAGMHAAPRSVTGEDRKAYDLAAWGRLPVNFEGREMPLDTMARSALKVISGKETFVIEAKKDEKGNVIEKERKIQAVRWLADVMSHRPEVLGYKVIRIDEPGVKADFGLPPEEKLFSYKQILPDAEPIKFQEPPEWQAMTPSQFTFAAFAAGIGSGSSPAGVSVSDMADQSDLLVENVNRWAQQVGLPASPPGVVATQLASTTLDGIPAKRIDLSGPGDGQKGPLRTVAVIATPGKRSWVFKITGPAKTVESELSRFEAFLGSVRFNKRMEKFQSDLNRLAAKQEADRFSLDLYERKLLALGSHMTLYNRLAAAPRMYLVPPLKAGENWQTLNEAAQARNAGGTAHPALNAMTTTLDAWKNDKPDEFNKALATYQQTLERQAPDLASKAGFEAFYNHFSPFWVSFGLYVFALALGCLSWLTLGGPLARGALTVLIVSFIIHTFGLVSRIYISGRPPVTNLYSSAVFIAWVVVLVCIVLERVFKNGLPMVAAALVGFMSLLVAGGIEFADATARSEGDTMAQLQAVLDTNFWLATHVVMITMGYAATFLAGALAVLYVLGGVASQGVKPDGTRTGLAKVFDGPLGDIFSDPARKLYVKMVYGVVCFAMLLSFIGTILGGIWADQSWGRFWGWDSKENGAILLVLWNAIILHARWGGMIRERGLMSLCILGNIITAWSWFGTNELGIGLHSYGFTEGVVPALLGFWGLNAALAVLAVVKVSGWRSISGSAE